MTALRGLAILIVLQAAGKGACPRVRTGASGPVVGLALLLPALKLGWVAQPVAAVSEQPLAHLSLLFVPVGVGGVTHLLLLSTYGLRLLGVVVLSTWIGRAATTFVLGVLLRERTPVRQTRD
jgi:holin-like protein